MKEHSGDMRPGSLQAIVALALSRANLEGSVNCRQDELRARGGCQGHSKLCLWLCHPSPEPLPLPLCLFFIFLAGWVKGQPQACACRGELGISPNHSVPARGVFSGAVNTLLRLHPPAERIAELC